MKRTHQPPRKSLATQGGSLLIEAMIAIVIFSLGILAIVGLQATTMRQTADAKQRLDASFFANEQLALVWADRNNASNFNGKSVAVPALPQGTCTIAVAQDAASLNYEVTLTVTWQAPGETSGHRYSTVATISG